MSKHSEAGKGSTPKLKQKSLYDENYEKIWGNKRISFMKNAIMIPMKQPHGMKIRLI